MFGTICLIILLFGIYIFMLTLGVGPTAAWWVTAFAFLVLFFMFGTLGWFGPPEVYEHSF